MARPIISFKPNLWPKDVKHGKSGVSLKIAKIDIDKVINNLKIVGDTVTYNAARALADSLVAIISYAQPRVPYYEGGKYGKASTGQLRESGKASIYLGGVEKIVATGNKDGTVSVNMTGITKSAFGVGRKKIHSIFGDISYVRVEDGLDIALWTHENLLPFDQRIEDKRYYKYAFPAARGEGTGPKYLEVAFLQNKSNILAAVKEAVNLTPDKLSAKVKKAKATGKYDVDKVDLVMKETSRSYFKGIQVKSRR